MKKILLTSLSVLALSTWVASAQVLNNGTTTSNLINVTTGPGSGGTQSGGTFTLTPNFNGQPQILLSGQVSDTNFWRLRGTSYSTTAVTGLPSSGTMYSVSAVYENDNDASTNFGFGVTGGVMGWFDTTSNIGIGFGLIGAGGGTGTVSLAEYDLDTGFSGGVTTSNFFELDGSAFSLTGNTGLSRAEGTFSMSFIVPTAAEILAVPGATARVEVDLNQGGSSTFSKSFLTTLALPTDHRVGYFAGYETNTNLASGDYGIFTDLTLTVVPEPTSAALLMGAFGLLAFRTRGRRR